MDRAGDFFQTPRLVGSVGRHDEHAEQATLATLLARHPAEGHPVPIGVFRDVDRPTFEEQIWDQGLQAVSNHGAGTIEELLDAGDRWQV